MSLKYKMGFAELLWTQTSVVFPLLSFRCTICVESAMAGSPSEVPVDNNTLHEKLTGGIGNLCAVAVL